MNSPSRKAVKHSVTPLSSSGRDVGLAISPARMNLRDGIDSQLLPNAETLKLTPSMSAVAAQVLIKSAHQLIDHPGKSPKRVVETSDDEGTLEHTASFENEGQMISPPEDDGKEGDVDSLVDPATQVQREAGVAKIRPSVWAEDAANVKRIKQRQTAFGHVSDKLLFSILNLKLVFEDILDLIVSRLSPDVFIDCQPTAMYQPNLDTPCIKHMYTKFKFAYVIQLCLTSADFSTPQLFAGVITPHTMKKHTMPGVMAKP